MLPDHLLCQDQGLSRLYAQQGSHHVWPPTRQKPMPPHMAAPPSKLHRLHWMQCPFADCDRLQRDCLIMRWSAWLLQRASTHTGRACRELQPRPRRLAAHLAVVTGHSHGDCTGEGVVQHDSLAGLHPHRGLQHQRAQHRGRRCSKGQLVEAVLPSGLVPEGDCGRSGALAVAVELQAAVLLGQTWQVDVLGACRHLGRGLGTAALQWQQWNLQLPGQA